MYFMGIAAFALLFGSDVNDAFFGRKGLRFLFPAGALVLAAGILLEAFSPNGSMPAPALRVVFCALAVLSAAALVYALFFALPVDASYGEPGQERAVCSTGLYALCRHPGVLIFAFMMLFFRLGTGLGTGSAVLYTVLNILLAAFEDTVVFPRRLKGYAAYRAATPFIIPTPRSVREAISGRR